MAGGRKLSFDKEASLEKAMLLFWEKGYAATALSELTDAMGINKPSMYSTFGNKEELFIQATDFYINKHAKKHIAYLEQSGTPREKLQAYMESIVSAQSSLTLPKGCYISLSVSEAAGGSIPAVAAKKVEYARGLTHEVLTEFFNTHGIEGAFSANEKALFIESVLHGTAAMARGDIKLDKLKTVVKQAVSAVL